MKIYWAGQNRCRKYLQNNINFKHVRSKIKTGLTYVKRLLSQ